MEGARLSARNALSLSSDARLLFDNNRFASAMALGMTSLQECGKVVLLISQAGLLKDNETAEWENLDSTFRSHELKHLFAFFMQMGLPDAVRLQGVDFLDAEAKRRAALYVDIQDSGWSTPVAISKQEGERVVVAAQFFALLSDQMLRWPGLEDALEKSMGELRGKSVSEMARLVNEKMNGTRQ